MQLSRGRSLACFFYPDTLTSISQLGLVLAREGKYIEAESMHQQDLLGSEKVLGSENPVTLTSMHNLAFTLKQLGKFSDTLSLFRKYVDLYNQVLGLYHPHAISLTNALCA
jgi:hypothetical protein